MLESMPQEIEVRFILPAIRRELANTLMKDNGLSQKDAASIMGLTESAISQYRHSKRAREVAFSDAITAEIKKSAKKILSEKNNRQRYMAEMNRLSALLDVRKLLCDLHRRQSKELSTCNVCFEENLLSIKGD
jgi:predicted transcriptional regulator